MLGLMFITFAPPSTSTFVPQSSFDREPVSPRAAFSLSRFCQAAKGASFFLFFFLTVSFQDGNRARMFPCEAQSPLAEVLLPTGAGSGSNTPPLPSCIVGGKVSRVLPLSLYVPVCVCQKSCSWRLMISGPALRQKAGFVSLLISAPFHPF